MTPQSSQTAMRHAWEWPDCPDCESNVYVSASRRGGRGEVDGDFECHLCGLKFDDARWKRRAGR